MDDTPGSYGGILRSVYTGLNTSNKSYSNMQNVSDIVNSMKSGDIKFEKNSLVIFAGCNTGTDKDENGKFKGLPLAKDFTMYTGVTTIGAVGGTAPDNKGTASRSADEGYYMFQRINDGNGNYSITSTFLGFFYNVLTPLAQVFQPSLCDGATCALL